MTISTTEIDGRINALTEQRNEALNRVVLLAGLLEKTLAQVAELEAKVAELTPNPEAKSEE